MLRTAVAAPMPCRVLRQASTAVTRRRLTGTSRAVAPALAASSWPSLPLARRHASTLSSLASAVAGGGGSSGGSSSEAASHRAGSTLVPRFQVGFAVVPQQIAFVVERLGKFHQVLDPGLHFLIPFVDKIAYAHSLKEESIPIPNQQAITKDNVTLSIDGVLFLRIVDAYQASYGVQDAVLAVAQLAQTSMRSEIGKMTLDKTFEERDTMNQAIVKVVNGAAQAWGIQVLRYEIRDIIPPPSIKQAMEMEAEAERRRRAEVLQSEGDRQSEVNLAQGKMQSAQLQAKGEAEAIRERARATAEGIRLLSSAISESKAGDKAVALRVAEQYVAAWKEMARKSNTIIVPANPSDASGMVATAMSIFKQVGGGIESYGSSDIPSADGRNASPGDAMPSETDDGDSAEQRSSSS
mmetsp:Transcript_37245/g.67384  ORF Transcript_37245/g.67384 Transcript_37245/m.67384 type:complete len:409 (+) Transcript_37245:122-1348(+)